MYTHKKYAFKDGGYYARNNTIQVYAATKTKVCNMFWQGILRNCKIFMPTEGIAFS